MNAARVIVVSAYVDNRSALRVAPIRPVAAGSKRRQSDTRTATKRLVSGSESERQKRGAATGVRSAEVVTRTTTR